MAGFLQSIGPWAPVLVFVLATAEAAAFLGVFVPGEMAVILGGVAAATGAAPLWTMILAAVVGAITGDSIGYQLGHRIGPRLLERPRFEKITARLESATSILSRRGWWALVVARFTSVLRAVVPFAAGMGAMPYGRFLVGNVIGGVLWGVTFTLVGFLAGANYTRVETWFRTGGLVVAGLVLTIGGLVWITKWIAAHPERVKRRFEPLLRWRVVRWLVGAAAGPVRRIRASVALAAAATMVIIASWVFAGLLQDVLASEEFFLYDGAAMRYLAANPVEPILTGARWIHQATTLPVLGVVAAVVTLSWLWRRQPRAAVATLLAPAGAWSVAALAARLVARVPPPFDPLVERVWYGFPSPRTAVVSALFLVLAWPWTETRWSAVSIRFGVAAIAATLAGASSVALLVEYPSDGLGGMAVAAIWTFLTCAVLDPRVRSMTPPGPAGDPVGGSAQP